MASQNVLTDIFNVVGENGVKTDNTIHIETTNLFLLVSYCFILWLAGKYILKSYCKQ